MATRSAWPALGADRVSSSERCIPRLLLPEGQRGAVVAAHPSVRRSPSKTSETEYGPAIDRRPRDGGAAVRRTLYATEIILSVPLRTSGIGVEQLSLRTDRIVRAGSGGRGLRMESGAVEVHD